MSVMFERSVTARRVLLLYYSEHIEGPYRPHKMNPIATPFPRNGGRLFVDHLGRLIRFAQVSKLLLA